MKIHPLNILLIGFFILSLVFNYAQSVHTKRLKKELQNSKSRVILFPIPENQIPKKKPEVVT